MIVVDLACGATRVITAGSLLLRMCAIGFERKQKHRQAALTGVRDF
jgi:hypothetical protein